MVYFCKKAKQTLRKKNSLALLTFIKMQVVFHLQTRSPPVLPPICELFGIGADAVEARPLHKGRPADMALLEVDYHFNLLLRGKWCSFLTTVGVKP